MIKKILNNRGYTLVEVVIASGLFAIMMTIVSVISVQFYQTQRKERMLNSAYEEGRFIIERMVGYFRDGNTIDYSEYYCQRYTAGRYGACIVPYQDEYGITHYMQEYESKFHDKGDITKKHEGCFDASQDPNNCIINALETSEQDELYLKVNFFF